MTKRFWIGAAAVAAMLMSGTALAETAKVMSVTGEAFIANQNGIFRAKPGMACEAGDMVMTRAGSSLDLSVAGQAGCRMFPGTTAAIASIRPGNVRLIVAEGNVVLNVKKLAPEARFSVETPVSIAAVRGTQFWGRVTGSENQSPVSTFAVREGAVEILAKSSDQRVTLRAGQAVDLTADAGSIQLRPALAQELEAMAVADQIAIAG